jgi:transcriptional regulator with XRE-family HTH domain
MAATFGDRLRALRTAQGWSQEELAWRSGLTPVTISLLERTVDPVHKEVGTLVALARALEVSLGQLAGLEDLALPPAPVQPPPGGPPGRCEPCQRPSRGT